MRRSLALASLALLAPLSAVPGIARGQVPTATPVPSVTPVATPPVDGTPRTAPTTAPATSDIVAAPKPTPDPLDPSTSQRSNVSWARTAGGIATTSKVKQPWITRIAGWGRYRTWAAMMALPLPPGLVEVRDEPCDSPLGGACYWVPTYIIQIPGMRALSVRNAAGRYMFAHELGHVYDFRVLEFTDHIRIAKAAQWSIARPWLDGCIGGVYSEGGACRPGDGPPNAELFADAYAYCSTGLLPENLAKAENIRRLMKVSRDWERRGTFDEKDATMVPEIKGYGWKPGLKAFRATCAAIAATTQDRERQLP